MYYMWQSYTYNHIHLFGVCRFGMRIDIKMSGMVVMNDRYCRFYVIITTKIINIIIIIVGFTKVMSCALFYYCFSAL